MISWYDIQLRMDDNMAVRFHLTLEGKMIYTRCVSRVAGGRHQSAGVIM